MSEATPYLDNSSREDRLSGGARRIPIQTPSGVFHVWTKRVGNNPKVKVLLVHGGPGATHEYFECFDSYFPEAGIEYYYYDQLESAFSDQPNDTSLWNIDRFVDELEQVRMALGINETNGFILGHSWGGILVMEYGLKYPGQVKGLIISNMMASIPDYDRYAEEVLGPKLPAGVLDEILALEAEGKFTDPRYLELINTHYYPEHILRMPADEWPDPVVRGLARLNYPLYLAIQGPSEFGIRGNAKLKGWSRMDDLKEIQTPTLVIGAEYDTMDPEFMKKMSEVLPNGQYLYCPNGSHFAMYDDQEVYFDGLIRFIQEVSKQ